MDHPSMEEYLATNPYITNTTELMADMTVTDGYFNGRSHQQLPIVHLQDEEPIKTSLPEPPQEQQPQQPPSLESRPSQEDDDAQTVYSRVSFLSERSTLPPEYTSRRHSYDEEGRDVGAQQTEGSPLVTVCTCRHPQCITCVANGTAVGANNRRFIYNYNRRCGRGCSGKSNAKRFKFCCLSLIIVIIAWALFGGYLLRRAAHKFKEMSQYQHSKCAELLPGTYKETYTVPINGSLSTFSLSQSVIYDNKASGYNSQINVDGFVNIEHASDSDEIEGNEIKVKVEYQVSDESILHDIDIRPTENGVGIITNRHATNRSGTNDVCVFFRVTVKVPSSSSPTEISQFLIDTEHISVLLKPSLSLKVLDKAMLNSVTGNIWSKARQPTKIQDDENKNANFGLQAKRLLIGTTTGNIHGVWGLADYASFESKSGNVDIGVMQLSSFPDQAATTDFYVSTVSGDIAVHSVSNDGTLHALRRDTSSYKTRIQTVSGDIIGQYILGSLFSAQTISGDIEADILPISPSVAGRSTDHPITVETDNKSGRTRIAFLEATDEKVLTEPRSLLRMRRMQTVIGWLEDKRRKFWSYIRFCKDKQGHNKAGDIKSGQADVSENAPDVEPLYVDPEDAGLSSLAFFRATHYTVSGDVNLHYPAAFEGRIKATSLTGYIEIKGEGVEIIRKERDGPVGKLVEAVHGAEDTGVVDIQSINGDVKVCVGGLL